MPMYPPQADEMRVRLTYEAKLRSGDCLDSLREMPDESVQLIVTSPPYADRRKNTYGGIRVEDYVPWFLARSAEFKRVLKPDGSFVLNIKEHVVDGQRSLYVYKLVIALVEEQGWRYVEEYPWHKVNPFPGKWPNRFRDAFEHCYHFTKEKRFVMNQEAVMVPSRIGKYKSKTNGREESATGSGFARDRAKFEGRESSYPTNILHFPPEYKNRQHSAPFPEKLPEFFVRLFSNEGDIVFDPFLGSGTSGVVARRERRLFVGTDIHASNIVLAGKRMTPWWSPT